MGKEINQPVDLSETLRQYQQQFLPTTVDKDDDLIYDLGNLYCTDHHPIDLEQLKESGEEYLQAEIRDNAQLLYNKIFGLPTERTEDGLFAELPKPTTKIPREKPVPKPKAETKWERYAKIKGITKQKRGKMIFDEQYQEWRPRWGYKRANDDQHDWLIEDRPSERGSHEDPFLKRRADKKERISKQAVQEHQNINRGKKEQSSYEKFLSGHVSEGTQRRLEKKEQLQNELVKTRTSTASLGRFDKQLPTDAKLKRAKQRKPIMAITSTGSEKEKNLKMLDRMLTSGVEVSNKAVKRARVSEEDVFPNKNAAKKRKFSK